MKKAYIDSNVLVYRFLPHRRQKFEYELTASKEILNKFSSGTHLGVISSLTPVEFAGICQKVETYNTEKMLSLTEKEQEMHTLQEGVKTYKNTIPKILSLPHTKIVNGGNLNFKDVLVDAIQIMNETVGSVHPTGTRGSKFRFEFERAYTADLLHLLFAKYEKCEEFYTFDKNIKKIECHPLIEPLEIKTYGH